MRILIDTHIALWTIADSDALPEKAKALLEDTENEVFYSTASIWEIAIKHKAHPHQMEISEEGFDLQCSEMGFQLLRLKREHIYTVKYLAYPDDAPKHTDPFDRLMIAQAKHEGMLFLTHDNKIGLYDEDCVLFIP